MREKRGLHYMKTEKKLGMDSAEGVQREPINNSNDVPEIILEPMIVSQMEKEYVLFDDGTVGSISEPWRVWKFHVLLRRTARSVTIVEQDGAKPKKVPNLILWADHSPKRIDLVSRTFKAGAGVICSDPDGRPSLNLWRAIERWPPKVSVQPWLDQVAYLYPDEAMREKLLDSLAHTEQKPGELQHAGFLHIAKNTGTGRSWFGGTLDEVWRGYSSYVDISKLMESQFNDELAGKLLVVVDESREGAGENPYRHADRIKTLVNEKKRNINIKYGGKYTEYNFCRWLVFSNHDNALPLDNTDRRWHVARHTAAPLDKEYYKKLYAWSSNPESINAIGWYLSKRDISGFNPGEHPEDNDAKKTVINASKSMTQQYAQELVEDYPAAIMVNADIAFYLSGGGVDKEVTSAMRRAIADLGGASAGKPLKINGKSYRCWILRNSEEWLAKKPCERAQEAMKGMSEPGHTAIDIMGDAVENKRNDIPY